MTNVVKCPTCGEEGAYVGATTVECVSESCPHFSARQKQEWTQTRETSPSEHDYHPPRYIWTNYHHDFGD